MISTESIVPGVCKVQPRAGAPGLDHLGRDESVGVSGHRLAQDLYRNVPPKLEVFGLYTSPCALADGLEDLVVR